MSSPDPGPAAAHLRLGPEPASVGRARRFAVTAAEELGADEDAQDAVRTLVSELVTNVVLHARTDLVVAVSAGPGEVRVEVADGSAVSPRRRRPTPAGTTGRGLRLVEVLSDRWGVDADDRVAPGGKVSWFTVHLVTSDEDREALARAALALFDTGLPGVS